MGLLDPATSDGRVIFFLPWLKGTIAGTTDLPCKITHSPRPTEDEIQFILTEVKNYLNPDVEVRRGDVLSAWSGIRPLVSDPNKGDTQSLARNHVVHVSPGGLVTIAGGKWTTYRAMAAEAVDAAVESACLLLTASCLPRPSPPCSINVQIRFLLFRRGPQASVQGVPNGRVLDRRRARVDAHHVHSTSTGLWT